MCGGFQAFKNSGGESGDSSLGIHGSESNLSGHQRLGRGFPKDDMVKRNGGATNLPKGTLNTKGVPIAARRMILDFCRSDHEETTFPGHGYEVQSQKLKMGRSCTFKIFEIVGVVDHPSTIRILVVDPDLYFKWGGQGADWSKKTLRMSL